MVLSGKGGILAHFAEERIYHRNVLNGGGMDENRDGNRPVVKFVPRDSTRSTASDGLSV